ncbi:MAG: endonuclease/exonuclease/phosphatase family protein, partial [Sciscionella sp.]
SRRCAVITIGTWNLENLFRPGNSAGPDSDAAYDDKLTALAKTIAGLAPEGLAVQEVGDPEALDDLAGRLDGTWHTETADADGRGIRVGVLSRLALSGAEQVTAFPEVLRPVQVDDDGGTMTKMGRPALRVRVESGGTTLDLLSCHLKSKLLTFPGGRFSPDDENERARFAAYALNRRTAEAVTVRGYVTALLRGDGQHRAVVVAGDLNDEPAAATTQILLGPSGSEIGTAGFPRPDRGDANRLWNLAPLIPEAQRFSRIYNGRRELIDHLLVSHAVVHAVDSVVTGDIDVVSVTDQPSRIREEPGSDHRPVVVRVRLG